MDMSKYPTTGALTTTVVDLSWLAGNWYGERDDVRVEEHWSAPAGNAMMGMFRWTQNDQVRFYEFMTIEQDAEGIALRVKHFDPSLIGWEEKDTSVAFSLVQLDTRKAVFAKRDTDDPLWMIYQQVAENTLVAYFESEGELPEMEDAFRFTRRPAG
jgi:hypothetical protein